MSFQKNKNNKTIILKSSGLDSGDDAFLFPLLGAHKKLEENKTTTIFDSFVLVGKGDSVGCGDFLPLLCCQVCMAPILIERKCGMKRCSNCWEKWVRDHANKIAITLVDAKRQKAWQRYPVKHVVISPDPRLYHMSVEDLRKEALAYLQKMGKGRDGVLVFHAFRPNDRFWREYPLRDENNSDDDVDDVKKWGWIREKENWRDYVKYAPHFHFLGFVWMAPPKKNDLWIYKNVQIIKGGKGLFKTVRGIAGYLLSHTVDKVDEDYFMAFSWCGRLSHRARARLHMLRAYKRYLAWLKEMRKKSLHCVKCGGGVWFTEPNLNAFFKAWYGRDFDLANISELKRLVKANLYREINRNVLELLDMLKNGPPIEPKGYQIANYEEFLATLP